MSEIRRENEPQNIREAAELDGDVNKRLEIASYVEWAKSQLRIIFGIENLSTIEGVKLRNIIESLMPKYKKESEQVFQGEMNESNFAEMEEEAATIWLYEVYGVHNNNIPWVNIIEDETTGEKYTFEKLLQEKANEKKKELEGQGHEVWMHSKVPDDFKEYLRRLRDNAHGAEVFEPK